MTQALNKPRAECRINDEASFSKPVLRGTRATQKLKSKTLAAESAYASNNTTQSNSYTSHQNLLTIPALEQNSGSFGAISTLYAEEEPGSATLLATANTIDKSPRGAATVKGSKVPRKGLKN